MMNIYVRKIATARRAIPAARVAAIRSEGGRESDGQAFELVSHSASPPQRRERRGDLRLALAVALGRIAGGLSRVLRIGGGTTLPGVVAELVDRRVLEKLSARLPQGTILVTGTNGKTTTSRILATILDACGLRVVHNRAGANLASGIITALLAGCRLDGRARTDCGLFEVDEAVVPVVLDAMRPKIVIITNLFRDQLDRYGEIDFLAARWHAMLRGLPRSSTIVLNVDDPAVASLGIGLEARVAGFGVDAPSERDARPDDAADSKNCPLCGALLTYRSVRYSHLGNYACPNGDFVRPVPELSLTRLTQRTLGETEIEIAGAFGLRIWRISLPGIYNAYNVLAAVQGALSAGIPMREIDSAAHLIRGAFGRFEQISIRGRSLCVVLVKNPVGLTEVVRTILAQGGARYLAILINDNLADGTDVSWLWDADVRGLAKRCLHIVVGGTRANDLALRLKYAGVPPEKIELAGSVRRAVERGLELVPEGETLYALPTYTAMLEVRRIIARQGHAEHYWKG